MIANYGYKDGSGEYFISIDSDRCNGCGDCVPACPAKILEMIADPYDPLSDKVIAAVREEERKKIKYSCAPCKPTSGPRLFPCLSACKPGAISHSW